MKNSPETRVQEMGLVPLNCNLIVFQVSNRPSSNRKQAPTGHFTAPKNVPVHSKEVKLISSSDSHLLTLRLPSSTLRLCDHLQLQMTARRGKMNFISTPAVFLGYF